MQYVFFEKRYTQTLSGANSEAAEFSRIIVLKVILQSVTLRLLEKLLKGYL